MDETEILVVPARLIERGIDSYTAVLRMLPKVLALPAQSLEDRRRG